MVKIQHRILKSENIEINSIIHQSSAQIKHYDRIPHTE